MWVELKFFMSIFALPLWVNKDYSAQAHVIGSVGNVHNLDSWKSKWPGNIILLYFIDLLGDKKKKEKIQSRCSPYALDTYQGK